MRIDPTQVSRIMGGAAILDREIGSIADLQYAVEAGLPVGALDETIPYVTTDPREASALCESAVPRTTLSRRTRLRPGESEKVERIARS
jgi:uncharacterized protein (DUF2384 family)